MNKEFRIYDPRECAVFCKTREKYGGNSNMAAGFILMVNSIMILTSEALYQACRFPDFPDLQKRIIEERSPMTAKMIGKPYQKDCTRKDWDLIKVKLMRWCIRVKLLQNWKSFSDVLLETGDMPIVEKSTKGDDFWGAVVVKEGIAPKRKFQIKRAEFYESPKMPAGFLVGYNLMGRLNQELRENIKTGIDPLSNNFTILEPLPIENFLLYGKPIEAIARR